MTEPDTCTADVVSLSTARPVAYAPRMEHLPDDSALMLRYRDGDVDAFETLYRRHNDALYRYVLRLCYNRAAAEDIFQDVWGKIINARASYRPTAKFRTFLFRVAHNCFIDHLRRHRRHEPGSDVDPDSRASEGASPEDETERALARRRLDAALEDIPLEQRDAFLLHEEAHLSIEQIAEVTGVNRETAKSRLRYAVNKLRAAMDSAGVDATRTDSEAAS